jgi:tetratricopeptide (TPR) repeat protein
MRREAIFRPTLERNPRFSGRQSILRKIEDYLKEGQMPVLFGLGGAGKTQIATEFAHRQRANYDVIWGIRGPEKNHLELQLAELAVQLGTADDLSLEQKLRSLEGWCNQGHTVLLVVDDIANPASLPNFLRSIPSVKMIVTTRYPNWKTLGQPIEVECFSRDEGLAFIKKRLGQTDETAGAALCEKLGFLPLALEQACAYIEAADINPARYSKLFDQQRLKVLEAGGPVIDYPETVASAWLLSIGRIEQENILAVNLLRTLSFFSTLPIPRHLFEIKGTGTLLDGCEELERLGAFAELRKYSLISSTENLVAVHGLVQEVCLSSVPKEKRPKILESAIMFLEQSFPKGTHSPETWKTCANLLPHANKVLEHLFNAGSSATGNSWWPAVILLQQLGCFSSAIGEFSHAKDYLLKAMSIAQGAQDPPNVFTACLVHNFACVLRQLGELAGARECEERALSLLGPNDKEQTAIVLVGLAQVEGELGNHERTAKLLNQAVSLSPDPVTLGSHSAFLHMAGDWENAVRLGRQALTKLTEDYGDSHPLVHQAKCNLAASLQSYGNLVEAETLAKEAVTSLEEIFGNDHPEYASALQRLASISKTMGRFPKALEMYCEVLDILERKSGTESLEVAPILGNVANLLESSDPRRESYFRRSMSIVDTCSPNNLAMKSVVKHNLGEFEAARGNHEIAETLLREADKLALDALGPSHPNRIGTLLALADVLSKLSKDEQVEELISEAVNEVSRTGFPVIGAVRIMVKAAYFYEEKSKLGKAAWLFQSALRLCQDGDLTGPFVSELETDVQRTKHHPAEQLVGTEKPTPFTSGLKHVDNSGDPPELLPQMFGLPPGQQAIKVLSVNNRLDLFALYPGGLGSTTDAKEIVLHVSIAPDGTKLHEELSLDEAKSKYKEVPSDWTCGPLERPD